MIRAAFEIPIVQNGRVVESVCATGYRVGDWFAHRSVSPGGEWDITHVPTLARIYSYTGPLTRAESLRVVRRLGERYPSIGRPGEDRRDVRWVVEATVAEALEGVRR